jgi:hypothetical protein
MPDNRQSTPGVVATCGAPEAAAMSAELLIRAASRGEVCDLSDSADRTIHAETSGFAAQGEVRLLNAKVGDQLSCIGGTFTNPSGIALYADHMSVTGSVFLGTLTHDERFTAVGEVSLRGAKIGGQLACDGSSFSNPQKNALSASNIDVEDSIFFEGVSPRRAK